MADPTDRSSPAQTFRITSGGIEATEDYRPAYLDGRCPNDGAELVPYPRPDGLTCPRCGFHTNVRRTS